MKSIIIAAVLASAMFWYGAVPAFAEEPVTVQPNHVIVYYFCTDYRCSGCTNVEKWIMELVAADFKDEVASGKIVFNKICTYAKGSEHFMEDYYLCGDSIVLVLIKDGKEVKFANLARLLCCYMGSKNIFEARLNEAISKFLKDL